MAFPQSFLDELHARSDILDIVGSYVPLQSKGGSYWGCCPFHNEKTPSFHVLPDRQMYHCFGCKKGGGVLNFIMEIEHLSYPDAVRFLAKRVGLSVPEDDRSGTAQLRSRLLSLNRDAARYFYAQLGAEAGAPVRAYLEKRRISPANATRFGLGAAPDRWTALLDAMTQKGYSKSELLAAGLVVQGKGGRLYDKFRSRLIFPLIDVRGDVLGFGGRVLDRSEPKYMNTPETILYSKRRALYGIHLAKKTQRKNWILCEGNIDVVMLHQAGFDNAVASMGTALTPEQLRLIARYTKELVLCYDNDGAGQAATQKALELLRNTEFSVRVLELPRRMVDGEAVKQDADDFIKYQGAAAFEHLLNGSESSMDYRMAQLAARFDLKQDSQRILYAGEVSTLLAGLSNAVEREIYTRRAAEAAGIRPEAMEHEVERALRQRVRQERKDASRQELRISAQVQPQERSLHYQNPRSAVAEEGIVRLLLLDDSIFGAEPALREEEFSSPLLGKCFSRLWQVRAQGHRPTLNDLTALLSGEEMSHISTILQKPESLAHGKQALQDYINIVRREASRGSTDDALLRVTQKYKENQGYGGK